MGDRVLLFWPPYFRAKNHNEEHSPACPSIKKMSHYVRYIRELDNCPVVNWEVYHKRRLEKDGGVSGYLWTRSQAMTWASFKSFVLEALRRASHSTDGVVRPHQAKKLLV